MAKETAEERLKKMMQKTTDSVAGSASSKVSSKKKISFAFTIGMLNQLLVLGVIVCIIGLFIEMRSGFSLLGTQVDFSDSAKTTKVASQGALPKSKTPDYYLAPINTRNIFKPYEGPAAVKVAEVKNLTKRLSKYKLVGVAWLDLPETASIMIEDTENKTTYFLKTGEQLEGVTVKTIYTDRAVFSYENEETTIKL